MPDPQPPPSECANCGAALPRTARACPECGADERTGWREPSIYDGLDLPEAASAEPAGGHPERSTGRPSATVNGLAWYWWVAGIALLVLFVAVVLVRGLRL